jgi:3-phosphoshikimate 1-carboxyvinyltransferase
MRIRVHPGRPVGGPARVPGDKSIAHRWLMLAATADGPSRLVGLPPSLDVRSTAAALASITPSARPALEAWLSNGPSGAEGHGSTWNAHEDGVAGSALEVEGEGRRALVEARSPLDCGNSGTSMRLLAGVLAAAPFRSVLAGDITLSRRPMERVAEPLRAMGADVATIQGHAPLTIVGGLLHGIRFEPAAPSAQVKGAILLAGLAASGTTAVVEPVATRDHTERAILALGGPVRADGPAIEVEAFQHAAFEGQVPGDPSSAAFLVAASALTGAALTLVDVGLNPTRIGFLEVARRMGVAVAGRTTGEELGEPVGELTVRPGADLVGTRVPGEELAAVIDEVPVLAALAAHAGTETRFEGAGELRVKESDRLGGLAAGLTALGGAARVEGDDLVISGGGLAGGTTGSAGDHRLAMAFVVAGLAATGPTTVEDAEVADVSFPGFARVLEGLGADLEVSS